MFEKQKFRSPQFGVRQNQVLSIYNLYLRVCQLEDTGPQPFL